MYEVWVTRWRGMHFGICEKLGSAWMVRSEFVIQMWIWHGEKCVCGEAWREREGLEVVGRTCGIIGTIDEGAVTDGEMVRVPLGALSAWHVMRGEWPRFDTVACFDSHGDGDLRVGVGGFGVIELGCGLCAHVRLVVVVVLIGGVVRNLMIHTKQ